MRTNRGRVRRPASNGSTRSHVWLSTNIDDQSTVSRAGADATHGERAEAGVDPLGVFGEGIHNFMLP